MPRHDPFAWGKKRKKVHYTQRKGEWTRPTSWSGPPHPGRPPTAR